MTPKEKDLLLRDLCARLPYGLKVKCEKYPFPVTILYGGNIDEVKFIETGGIENICAIKPYLFPLSSMTDKDLIEFLQIKGMNLNSDELKTFRREPIAIVSTLPSYSRHIDWLNKNHFDYRNLIDKNLAIDCTNLNIY